MNVAGNRFLVTGGAGFIGSELVRQLVGLGGSVIVIDNLSTGHRTNLDTVSGSGSVEFVETDIRDTACVKRLMHGVDAIFHLACLGVRHSIHAPEENHEVNASATLQLLMMAKAADVKRFVHISSSEVYGTAQWAPMTENHPTFPMTVYGASKLAGECYARAFHRTYGFPAVVIRPFNAYGPRCHHEGDSGEVIPKFMLRCSAGLPMVVFGDGAQTRDFTFVGDTARGIIDVGLHDSAVGMTINIGSGKEISIRELARTVAQVVGKAEHQTIYDVERPGDVLRLCADASKAEKLFGFKPHVSLLDGLQELFRWYQSLGKSPEELLQYEKLRSWEQ